MNKGMKMKKRIKVIVVFALCFIGLGMNAQSSKFHFLGTVGITKPIMNNGLGASLGFNPSYAFGEILSVESQVSYTFTNVTGSFIVGDKGTVNELGAFIGPRVYFNKAEKRTRFYINLLIGGVFVSDNVGTEDDKYISEWNLGLTTGFYVERDSVVYGLAVQSYESFVLKIGFQF